MAYASREPEITTASDPPGSIEAELLPQHGERPKEVNRPVIAHIPMETVQRIPPAKRGFEKVPAS
jgi:hypothetical protein